MLFDVAFALAIKMLIKRTAMLQGLNNFGFSEPGHIAVPNIFFIDWFLKSYSKKELDVQRQAGKISAKDEIYEE